MNNHKNRMKEEREKKEQAAPAGEPENAGEPNTGEGPTETLEPGLKSAPAGEGEEPIDSLEDLKQQLEEQSDRYLRLMAEFDNFKKRVSRDYERLVELASEKLIRELLEVRENFERAIRSDEKCTDPKNIFDGMKLIFAKFNDVLTGNGLESFAAAGEPFDPQLHDALLKVPDATIPEDHIVEVFEKGYYLKKRVLRHAKVIVSSGAPEGDSQ